MDEPFDLGIREEVGVTLILLDVEVRDEHGNPIRGLTRDQFRVWDRAREWQVHSVDDLCACEAPASVGVPRRVSDGDPHPIQVDTTDVHIPEDPAAASRSRVFVMYFDFSQMRSDGRKRALEQARRWIRELMHPADQVLLAGYASQAGLRLISPSSSNRELLLSRLEAAFADDQTKDWFPEFRAQRITLCEMYPTDCYEFGEQEYLHSLASLRNFKRFLAGLEILPGRKQVLHFTQNGALSPYTIYGVQGPGLRLLAEEIGAEASVSRAVVNTVVTGNSGRLGPAVDEVASMGWNLAESTGGAYNRTPAQTSGFLADLASRCLCTYRIGLVPRQKEQREVYVVRVEAAGRVLPHRYRIQYLTPADRTFRRIIAYLQEPDSAVAFPLSASLRPTHASGKAWDVLLQVRFDAISLLSVPRPPSDRSFVAWDVAGLLQDTAGKHNWEFFATTTSVAGAAVLDGMAALHDTVVRGLPPGTYRFRSLVRDRLADTFAGAEVEFSLPPTSEDAVMGPFCLAVQPVLQGGLPLRTERHQIGAGKLEFAALPCPQAGVPAEGFILMQSWICEAKPGDALVDLQGYVSSSGVPEFRLWPPVVSESGRCLLATHTVDVARLGSGAFRYHLARAGIELATLDFSVQPAPSSQATRQGLK